MDEFAVDPQRGAGVEKMGALDNALADQRAGDPLAETRNEEATSKADRIATTSKWTIWRDRKSLKSWLMNA